MLKFDPTGWRETYLEEKNNLLYYLKDFKIAINHIGATAYKNGRSNRNVDILITVETLSDLSAVFVRLLSKGYKEIKYDDSNYHLLVNPNRVLGYGVSIRIMVYASDIFNRYNAFIILLKEHEHLVKDYNVFREKALFKAQGNYQIYRTLKEDFINSLVKEYFKFE